MRYYVLRAALLAAVLCVVPVVIVALWLGLGCAAVVSALLIALGWIIYFHAERAVLTALRARQVSEVERPELYRLVRELARSARLPMPRLFVSPATQPNILTVGYGPRSAAVCCTDGLLTAALAGRAPGRARARAVACVAARCRGVFLVGRARVACRGLPAGGALLLQIAAPAGREYDADIGGALLTGEPLELASALRKIDSCAADLPLRPRGPLAAASHLMIACPFPPGGGGLGGLLRTHPPTGERVRRLEGLAGVAGTSPN